MKKITIKYTNGGRNALIQCLKNAVSSIEKELEDNVPQTCEDRLEMLCDLDDFKHLLKNIYHSNKKALSLDCVETLYDLFDVDVLDTFFKQSSLELMLS